MSLIESEAKVFILTGDARTLGAHSSMLLYGYSSQGPVEIISEFQPYFYVSAESSLPADIAARVQGSDFQTETKSLSGVKVKKISCTSIFQAEDFRKRLQDSAIVLFESDVKPRERFLMDRGINGGVIAQGPAEKRGGLLRFSNPKLTPAKVETKFSICSLDIETSISSREILSIGLHISGQGRNEQLVFMRGNTKPDPQIGLSFYPDERALLQKFLEYLRHSDPDVIIGWNVIGFDLAYLKNRAEILRVPLALGRDNRPIWIGESSGRFSRASIPGRVVLDGPQLLRNSFYSFESYSLENVSQKVLGEGKLIGPSGNKAWEIERLFKEDPKSLAEYNLKDCLLVTQIFEKLGLLDLTVKRSELSGMLLDSVGMSTASFDHFYLPKLHANNFVAPDVQGIGEVQSAAGGYVLSPVAGIYDDILGLDFQSLYPSIIRTFKIDPLSRASADTDTLQTPTGFAFSRTQSILPDFIGVLIAERRQAKLSGDKALSQAIKILMNSFYGVMGSAGSRLYHPNLPSAITSTGQWLLLESQKWLEERNHKVIYGDTDSLFVKVSLGPQSSSKDFDEVGCSIAKNLTEYWQERITREFRLESYLQLDFKTHYRKFLVPSARGSEGGAKKRYAGLAIRNGIEEVEFVGLEVVRSDWTKLARDFQVELYTKIFHGEIVDQWIRDFVAKVRKGEFDSKLVYRKRLHKNPDEYGSSPPPYVRAALLMSKPSREVRYVMTLKGPIPIDRSPSNPDYAHYIDRQLRPVADSILETLGTSFEAILSPQLRLF